MLVYKRQKFAGVAEQEQIDRVFAVIYGIEQAEQAAFDAAKLHIRVDDENFFHKNQPLPSSFTAA